MRNKGSLLPAHVRACTPQATLQWPRVRLAAVTWRNLSPGERGRARASAGAADCRVCRLPVWTRASFSEPLRCKHSPQHISRGRISCQEAVHAPARVLARRHGRLSSREAPDGLVAQSQCVFQHGHLRTGAAQRTPLWPSTAMRAKDSHSAEPEQVVSRPQSSDRVRTWKQCRSPHLGAQPLRTSSKSNRQPSGGVQGERRRTTSERSEASKSERVGHRTYAPLEEERAQVRLRIREERARSSPPARCRADGRQTT